jgi:hypothetical protein
MDVHSIMFSIFSTIVLGSVLFLGLAALLHVRNGRRDRLQMKRHLAKIELVDR